MKDHDTCNEFDVKEGFRTVRVPRKLTKKRRHFLLAMLSFALFSGMIFLSSFLISRTLDTWMFFPVFATTVPASLFFFYLTGFHLYDAYTETFGGGL